MMQKIVKNEKGSISLFVLLSALFFLVVVTSVGVSLKNKEAGIDAQFEKTKLSYEKDVGNEEQVYAEESKKHTVTFNANGGSANITSKVVREGEEYGELPTPTREGYTFKGWNGKNLLDLDDFVNTYSPYQNTKPEKVNFEDEEVWKMYGHVNIDGREIHYLEGHFKDNTQYDISLSIYEVWSQSGTRYYPGIVIYVNYSDGTSIRLNNFSHNQSENWQNVNYTSDKNKTISGITVSYGTSNAYSYIKNFQIEEGSEATEYEPYFVTSSTKVTQDKDHTLTAIWEQN